MYTMQTKFVAHIKDPTYHHYKSFPQTCWCPNADGMENPQTITMENPSILGNPAYYGGISGTTLWFILIRELVITFSCQYQGEHDSSVPHTFLVPPPPHTHTHWCTHPYTHTHKSFLCHFNANHCPLVTSVPTLPHWCPLPAKQLISPSARLPQCLNKFLPATGASLVVVLLLFFLP